MCLIDHRQAPRKSPCRANGFGKNLLCALFLSGSLVAALTPAAATENAALVAAVPASGVTAPFEYQLENRVDPFVPFITEKAATSSADMNEIVEDNKPLTGMQLFEPGQLTLVATLRKNKDDDVAMVEDFTGKGYVLLKGTKIGRRGVVTGIDPNAVTIEETAVTRAGKEIITKVVMTLKKEGEE